MKVQNYLAVIVGIAAILCYSPKAEAQIEPLSTRDYGVWDINVQLGPTGRTLTWTASSYNGVGKAKTNAIRCANEFYEIQNAQLTDPEVVFPREKNVMPDCEDGVEILLHGYGTCSCEKKSDLWVLELTVHFCCNDPKTFVVIGKTYREAHKKALQKVKELRCNSPYGPVKCYSVCVAKKPQCTVTGYRKHLSLFSRLRR